MSVEGGHWYLPDSSPFYEVRAKSGLPRAVTLRDARAVNAVPSVTTVLRVIAKPQLEAWKVKQGILAALTLPRANDEADDAYLGRVLDDSREQAKAAAEEGSRIHDAIECAFTGRVYHHHYRPHVEAVMALIAELFPTVHDWIAEKSFAHASGFGGRVDLHSPSTGIVIDYKGKDGDFTDGKRLHYDQHYQLAAYQDGLDLPRNVCANIFVSRTHPGKVAAHVWKVEDIEYGSEYFRLALALWKHHSKYDSTIQERIAA